jgi:hypothetical protein
MLLEAVGVEYRHPSGCERGQCLGHQCGDGAGASLPMHGKHPYDHRSWRSAGQVSLAASYPGQLAGTLRLDGGSEQLTDPMPA